MARRIVVGCEVKNGETRRALTPPDAAFLRNNGFNIVVQTYPGAVFADSDYHSLGLPLVDDTSPGDIVVGIKEFKPQGSRKAIKADQVLLGFHHAHKGQPHNRGMLDEATRLGASLFDYELYRIANRQQPITTSPHAGMAGVFNGLCAYLLRHNIPGGPKPGFFRTHEFMRLAIEPFVEYFRTLRILVIGSGGCGRGAKQFLCNLGFKEFAATDVIHRRATAPWFSVLSAEHVFKRRDGGQFNWNEYLEQGDRRYVTCFEEYLGDHDLLIHCPYWDDRYPRLVPPSMTAGYDSSAFPVISDVTCDIDGSLACTRRENTITEWVSVVDGVMVTAVDCLPTQIAESCSTDVSAALATLLTAFASAKFAGSLKNSGLPSEVQKGFLLWRGKTLALHQHIISPR